jgi:hypothetical protein
VSLVRRVRCDTCNAEREWRSTDGWLLVQLGHEDGAPRADFCSMPCLAQWASNRELETVR